MNEHRVVSRFDERERYELAAWLCALRDHWPTRFADLGERGAMLADAALAATSDANRLLKLRRIAIARIAAGERPWEHVEFLRQ